MRHSTRALALIAAAPLALGALGACSKDEVPGGTTGTTKAAAAGSSTTAAGPGTTMKDSTKGTGATGTSMKDSAGTTVVATPMGKVKLSIVTTPYGKAVGGPNGKVLYAWDEESKGGNAIKCTGPCLDKWPPVYADAVEAGEGLNATQYSVITRPDGKKQAAVNGRALYEMKDDTPGTADCQGLAGWYIVNPDGTKNDKTA